MDTAQSGTSRAWVRLGGRRRGCGWEGEGGAARGGRGAVCAIAGVSWDPPPTVHAHHCTYHTHTDSCPSLCVCGNTYVADVLVTPRNLQIFVGRSVEGVVPRLARRLRVEGGRRYFPASSVSKSREADSVDP